MIRFFDACLCAAFAAAGGGILSGCGPAPAPTPAPLQTTTVTISNGLEFNCIQTVACGDDDAQDVLMVHGYPERKEFWEGLIRKLDTRGGYCGVACAMHGYSPGASPDNMSSYHSDTIRRDTFEIATELGFGSFHLVAHDHGAILGWRMVSASAGSDRERILSFSSLSIPHLDAFSSMLFGENPLLYQQVASQYLTTYVLPNSASLFDNFWYNRFRCSSYVPDSCFATAADFQKAQWWYNGIFNDGVDAKVAMPPSFTVEEINATDYPNKAFPMDLRGVFSDYTGAGYEGYAQTDPVGNIAAPTLYICGLSDTAVFCSTPQAKATMDYCTGGYTYLEVDCGHGLTRCDDASKTEEVLAAIVAHLDANTPTALVSV